MKFKLSIILSIVSLAVSAQSKKEIPEIYTNVHYEKDGTLYFQAKGSDEKKTYFPSSPRFTYDKITITPEGTENGLLFNFKDTAFNGTMYYGFIHPEDKYPQPVFFKRTSAIKAGVAEINIKNSLYGKYDAAGWESSGRMRLGYRIADDKGNIIYDGKINVTGKGPFKPDVTIISGPFVNRVTDSSAVISFTTNIETIVYVITDGRSFTDKTQLKNYEIKVDGLKPATRYEYTVKYGDYSDTFSFKTAPFSGSRDPFTFAFASDSRAGQGGGERNIYGTNAYMVKKIMAMTANSKAEFLQFTGDMISGYSDNQNRQKLEYFNWKNTIEPFAHYFPVYVGVGNHEVVEYLFRKDKNTYSWKPGDMASIDKFPFETESAEQLFAKMFVHPHNGPKSEDGSKYDPDPGKTDFPSYDENVYYYTYDNMAMVVLNSNYLYAPSEDMVHLTGGNIHGYIMDNQLEWFGNTISKLEKDDNIDHIFVTIHTPAFPNGGHANNDMWYFGNNEIRPYIAGKPVDKGIIERRDEFLDIMVNKSQKVIALLCGDEHNYSRLRIDGTTDIYPENWEGSKLKLRRTIWQITNGSSGAPYYAQEKLPWSGSVEIFSTKYALVFFNIDGKSIDVEVINPDTGEEVDKAKIR